MTCIVGVAAKGKVWIGGDSAGLDTSNYMRVVRKDSKVFKLDTRFVIGYAGSFRLGQILRYKFIAPEKPEGQEDYEYLVTDWVDSLRVTLKEAGFIKVVDSVESLEASSALIGFNSRIYTLEGDLQISELVTPYVAIGSAAEYAMGSMDTSYKLSKRIAPRKRVLLALEAAAAFSAGVSPPFSILSL